MAVSKQSIRVMTHGEWPYEEAKAGEAGIYPGMLLERNSSGEFIKQATQGQKCQLLVALEDSLQGHTVNDVYTIGENVRAMVFRSGDEFCALLHGHTNITRSERLVAKGDGTFRSGEDSGSYSDSVLAISLEDENLSAVDADRLIHAKAL